MIDRGIGSALFLLSVVGLAASGCGDTTSGAGGGDATTSATGTASGPSTSAGSAGGPEQTCVDAINGYRATLGLPAYQRWNAAEACADGQAKSDGTSMSAHGAFGQCMESAQNECPGWPGPPESAVTGCLKMMWGEGPGADFATHGHYINMSSTKYTKVACGFHTFPDGSVWAVQDFQ